MRALLDILREPALTDLNVDTAARLDLHLEILRRKPMLAATFREFHRLFKRLADEWLPASGSEIELGSGISPMRDTYPEVLATDVVADARLDRALNAEDMDLPDSSVRVFYCQNCFHHFSSPNRFFAELERTLMPGGGAVILDPYYGPMAAFLYRRLFASEGFDLDARDWETPLQGPMQGANQALSYIVFVRDRQAFERRHPGLRLVYQRPVGGYLKYLLSGGLNFRQLLPTWTTGALGVCEAALSPLDRWLALHHVVVLRKGGA